MATTLLPNLIDPEVLADMISYELENKLQATRFFKIDRTLEGKAGSTITLPEWKYIGMADVLPENAEVDLTALEYKDQEHTIKKTAKAIELTDEAVLSGYGDPHGEAAKQLRISIQDRVEQDAIELLGALTPNDVQFHTATSGLDYEEIVTAADLLDEEEQGLETFIFVGRKIGRAS